MTYPRSPEDVAEVIERVGEAGLGKGTTVRVARDPGVGQVIAAAEDDQVCSRRSVRPKVFGIGWAKTGDLLVVDWARGDGWDALCGFLNVPKPDVPFPHLNRRPSA